MDKILKINISKYLRLLFTRQTILLITLTFALPIFMISCSKDESCNIKKKDKFCPTSCAYDIDKGWGVCGCDGKIYCNICIAEAEGVRVVSYELCQ